MSARQVERWPRRLGRALAAVLSAAAVAAGVVMVALAALVGHCGAFGGRCPAQPPPLLEDEAFGTAFAGAGLALAAMVLATGPFRRRIVPALVVALAGGLVVGLVVRSYVVS
jgi:hypothetical protein